MNADYLVNCIPLPAFANIPVTPALLPEKTVCDQKYSNTILTSGLFSRQVQNSGKRISSASIWSSVIPTSGLYGIPLMKWKHTG
jgi:hypothetical protein